MDYIHDIKAFAARMSAVAEEKLAIVDGGTYNEYMRLYSDRTSRRPSFSENDRASDSEEHLQFEVLLGELQQAATAPSLLSSPEEGSILFSDPSCWSEVGDAVECLSLALEKCLFFGAEGSRPDFWHVVCRAADIDAEGQKGQGYPSSGTVNGEAGKDPMPVGSCDGEATPNADGVGHSVPGGLALVVSRLVRVRTGYGLCRAWVRGLLGVGPAAVERELRQSVWAAGVAAASETATPVSQRGEAGDGAQVGAESNPGGTFPSAGATEMKITCGQEGTTAEAGTTTDPQPVGGVVQPKEDKEERCGEGDMLQPRHRQSPQTPMAVPGTQGGTVHASTMEQGKPCKEEPLAPSLSSPAASSPFPSPPVEATVVDAPSAGTSPRGGDKEQGRGGGDEDTSNYQGGGGPVLPLWLRPGGGGRACTAVIQCLSRVQTALSERGLSIRPRLDDASLDRENLSAITTYSWPGFQKDALRCTVRGGGVPEANGDYAPVASGGHEDQVAGGEDSVGAAAAAAAAAEAGNGLLLVGPNGFEIRQGWSGSSVVSPWHELMQV
ncbi:unnamed protein product, partial [Discosporangium mesarthrocarpum]